MTPSSFMFHEKFSFIQLIGFIIQVTGTLLFNEIIVIPILGFNKNTKKAKAE